MGYFDMPIEKQLEFEFIQEMRNKEARVADKMARKEIYNELKAGAFSIGVVTANITLIAGACYAYNTIKSLFR